MVLPIPIFPKLIINIFLDISFTDYYPNRTKTYKIVQHFTYTISMYGFLCTEIHETHSHSTAVCVDLLFTHIGEEIYGKYRYKFILALKKSMTLTEVTFTTLFLTAHIFVRN
jgi:hypothetical protein